ncbi:helix-turn-helix domain-containing protein [Conexibacter sp. S30A1]|uniref:helix-turn-helix domain-containing protein n=1 Tax=Conexibacter sp. S30A1 TaxID=2937800 RepID=UPI0035310CCE
MADIGGMLRAARVELGLGQAELAARAATTQTYVSRVERGVTEPSLSTLERLFHAMGLRLQITPEPIPLGNVSAEELRRDFLESTPQERISQVMTLSAFVTGVAAQAQERRARGTS